MLADVRISGTDPVEQSRVLGCSGLRMGRVALWPSVGGEMLFPDLCTRGHHPASAPSRPEPPSGSKGGVT